MEEACEAVNRTNFLILGGGTIGCSLAYHLSIRGRKVTVLERNDTATGTAGASGSLISWFSSKPGTRLDFSIASHQMLPQLERDLDCDIGLKMNRGNIQCIANKTELAIAEKLVREHRMEGYEAYIIGLKEAMKLEPAISPELLGAINIPRVHYLDPIKLAFAFRKNAVKHGAEFVNEAEVTGLIFQRNTCVGAHSTAGDYYGDAVINCCGSWAPRIGKMAGIHLPITPRRGQMLITEPAARFVNAEISSSTFEALIYHPELVDDPRILRYNLSFALEQTDTGTAIIHGTREDAGLDTGNDPEVIELLLQTACRIVPRLKEMKIIRAFSGLRPWSDDMMPFLGPVKSVPGFFLCCGHGGSGISMSAITGKTMSELLLDGHSATFDLSVFSPSRIQI